MKKRIGKMRDMYIIRNRILRLRDKHRKKFYKNSYGKCGLEIEFGVNYTGTSTGYIKKGLQKMKEAVGNRGKFVEDLTIGRDLNFEIVLDPMDKDELAEVFNKIVDILEFYEDFVFDDNCGVHANFRADDVQKRLFYNRLVAGGYDSQRFSHNKYKIDFMKLAAKRDGTFRTYEEFVQYQKDVCSKYSSVNFLKENLIEFRALDLNLDDILYVYDLYRQTCLGETASEELKDKVRHLSDYVDLPLVSLDRAQ
ncbi:MAG: hypothetical protein ACOX88_10065 [Christensenellales bacterium]|jgi:hypothetical protein